VKVPLAELVGAVNVTCTPLTGFELLSRTVATSGAANAVLIGALCGVPLVATMLAGTPVGGAPAVFVRLKLAVLVIPETEAITEYAPAVSLAVKIVAVAKPFASVVTVVVFVLVSVNVPLAPVGGAAKVTATPLAGDPLTITVATRGSAKAPSTPWLCGVPLVAAIISTVVVVRGRSFVTQPTSPNKQTAANKAHTLWLMVFLVLTCLRENRCLIICCLETPRRVATSSKSPR
jgi:hypothetical protein